MKRLRELSRDERKEPIGFAASLVEAVAPLAESEARRQRVERALRQRARGRRSAPRALALRWVAAAVLLLCSVVAGAAVLRPLVASLFGTAAPVPVDQRPATPASHRRIETRSAIASPDQQASPVITTPVSSSSSTRSGVGSDDAQAKPLPPAEPTSKLTNKPIDSPASHAANHVPNHAPGHIPNNVARNIPNKTANDIPNNVAADPIAPAAVGVPRALATAGKVPLDDDGDVAPLDSLAARLGGASSAGSVSGSSSPAPREDDSRLLLRAWRSLRSDGDPATAAGLAGDYLRLHPDGALVEEAYAIAIEAAVRRGSNDAAGLADRYRARFPSGRYLRIAERVRRHAP